MKPNAEVTVELLAKALSGLDQIVGRGDSEPSTDMLSTRLATEALSAVAVTLKYLLAKEGQAILPGFGTFSVAEGGTAFAPAEDLADYVALAEGDESRRIRGLAATTVLHLHAALSLLPHLQGHLDQPVAVSTSDAERTLQRVFGDTPHLSVRSALEACAVRIRAAVGQAPNSQQPQVHIESHQFPVAAVRDLIGPGGKRIRTIAHDTGARINVEDDGRVTVISTERSSVAKAMRIIRELAQAPQLDQSYIGKVQRITDFGAFVQIMPGVDGLLHVSEIASDRVENIRDVLKEGQEILVRVTRIDPKGRIHLSRKVLLGEGTEAQGEAARGEI